MSKHSKVDFMRNEVESVLGFTTNTKRYRTALAMARGANMQSKIYNVAKMYRGLVMDKSSGEYKYMKRRNYKGNKKRRK